MATRTIDLPVIKLRDYQQPVWQRLFKEDIKKAILIWHRRAGKDLFCLNYMISKATLEKGNYWFILPEAQQVRNAIWEGITREGQKYLSFIPKEIIHKIDNQSMKVYLKDPSNINDAGSIISFVGGDRYDKRVGAGLKGCVISEYPLQKPNLYDLAIEPMLKETNGWIIFNGTPRGNNHAKDMYDFLKSKKQYLASLLTIEDTGVVDPEQLEEERERGKPEELIQQEYYCSFEGAIFGSYYGDLLKKYIAQVGDYNYDARYPVHTAWDLGVSDSTAIWFFQYVENKIHIIDYYENNSYGLQHYVDKMNSKGYMYGTHNLPHDGRKRQLTATEKALSIEQQLKNLGLVNLTVHTRTKDVYGDICAVRSLLSRCYFNKEKTDTGYEALKQYRKEFDENRQRFKDTPWHDWTSHGADAFRIIPKVKNVNIIKNKPVKWKKSF
jgi:phage terminase large subunit